MSNGDPPDERFASDGFVRIKRFYWPDQVADCELPYLFHVQKWRSQ